MLISWKPEFSNMKIFPRKGIFSLVNVRLFVILLVLSCFVLLVPFFAGNYLVHVVIVTFYYIVVASSWNLLAGYTGLFSVAQNTFAGIGAYSSALFFIHVGVPPVIGIFMAAGVAAALSYGLGALTLKMKGMYLAISTWAFAGVVTVLVTGLVQYTGGELGLGVPYLFGTKQSYVPYYFVFFFLDVIVLALIYVLLKSKVGLYMMAIREDEVAAKVMGLDTYKWKKNIFALSGFFTGLSGALLAHYIGLLSPAMFRFDEMVIIIIMAILGGIGHFAGPMMGAVTIELASEYLRAYGELRMIIFAILIIVIVTFFRDGLVGLVSRIQRILTRARAHGQPLPESTT